MNPVSEDIKDFLIEGNQGKFAGNEEGEWGIFTMEEPAEPDMVITVFDTPGTSDKTHNSDRDFLHSAFLIRVRGTTYLDAYQKCEECRKYLNRFTTLKDTPIEQVVKDKMRYNNILMESESIPLGKDSNNLFIWVVNGIAFRQLLESEEKED